MKNNKNIQLSIEVRRTETIRLFQEAIHIPNRIPSKGMFKTINMVQFPIGERVCPTKSLIILEF